ncbi:Hypothetical predicted protein [Lecanosticta acicola]|uniref:Uncharacterized protein n=1 Tax=Lecanosticta acicola TaxID=111012 RepID=A0AAI9E7P5_9PEZI|nr:Hypothetical predicted protein [Lecanosticta acicola]
MGFQFNGAPPAWLDNSSTPKSFGIPSSTPSASVRTTTAQSFGPAASVKTAPSFGTNPAILRGSPGAFPSFPAAASNPHPPALQSTPNSSFGSSPPSRQSKAKVSPFATASSDTPTLSGIPCKTSVSSEKTDDALRKALQRASGDQFTATVGDADIAADEILKDALKKSGLNRSNVIALLQALGQSPELSIFTNTLFGELVGRRIPGFQSQSKTTTKPTDNPFSKPGQSEKKKAESSSQVLRHHPWVRYRLEIPVAQRLVSSRAMAKFEHAKVLAAWMLSQVCSSATSDKRNMLELAATNIIERKESELAIKGIVIWIKEKVSRAKVLLATVETERGTLISDDEDMNKVIRSASIATQDDISVFTRNPPASSKNDKPFRFLDLPAELRNGVYRELLVTRSGYLSTHRLGDTSYIQAEQGGTKFDLHSPGCHPAILETCKQVYKEAKSVLYVENVIVARLTANIGTKSVFKMGRMRPSTLPHLTNLVLSVDSIKFDGGLRGAFAGVSPNYAKLNWYALQSLTGLKKLRICNIERENQKCDFPEDHLKHKTALLEQIIERIPANCDLSYEAQEGIEKRFIQEQLQWRNRPGHIRDAYEVDGEVLKRCAQGTLQNQGAKSGDERNHFYADRSIKLGSLVKDGDEGTFDPRHVFGAGD